MSSWRDALPKLNEGLKGQSFVVGSPGYETEVAGLNEAVVHQPAVMVGAMTTADVCASVKFAYCHLLDVLVHNTGHGPSVSAGPNTLMITHATNG